MADSAIVVPQADGQLRAGIKRDYKGNHKNVGPPRKAAPQQAVRNEYTSMFEGFRDVLDEHHDRRMKIGKVSRDVTALSKKIIFSLQRARDLKQPIPQQIAQENDARVLEIKELLGTIQDDVRGIRRYRYALVSIEELVEAITFQHYLEHQTLVSPDQIMPEGLDIELLPTDYLYGVFDLTGEMMRFATANTALQGALPGSESGDDGSGRRNILEDLQEVSSMLQIIPPLSDRTYSKKIEVMVEQVQKVERVGYGVTVRGNERPKGWLPDMNDDRGGPEDFESGAA